MALLVFLPDKQIATKLLRLRGIPPRWAIGLLAEPGIGRGCRPVHRLAKLRRGEKDVFLADEPSTPVLASWLRTAGSTPTSNNLLSRLCKAT